MSSRSSLACLTVAAAIATACSQQTQSWDATFKVKLSPNSVKSFTVRVHPDWAPKGAAQFEDMVKGHVLDDAGIFRVVPGFMAQFGIPASPEVARDWRSREIKDDPVVETNTRGRMTFATAGPDTRTTQLFINYADNSFLDTQGFSPFAEVLGDGMDVVDQIQSKYKEDPDQGLIESQGNAYLEKNFKDLSYITVVESAALSLASIGSVQRHVK